MDTMFSIYVGCLILGGGLILISFFSDTDHDADVDVDVDVDFDIDADHDVDVPQSVDVGDALWLPILSLRFWIFFTAFFGLTGTMLHLLDQMSWKGTLGVSVGMGVGSGWLVSWIVRRLRSDKVDSNIDPERDYVGTTGQVILSIEPESPGSVRLNVKGVDIDLTAITEGAVTLSPGTQVKVQRYSQSTVCVVPLSEKEAA
ncbi:MAG: NfeD family protein [Planctomycetes bacterium]|nr:NfeD family protein [Planctomycetota bacterium]